MVRILSYFIAFVMASQLHAHVSVSDAEKLVIAENVLSEEGHYDAMEIEKRARLQALQQPLPFVEGTLLASGTCPAYPCAIPAGFAGAQSNDNDVPDITDVVGITAGNATTFINRFSLKLSSADLQNILLASEVAWYEVFVTYQDNNPSPSKNSKGPSGPGAYAVYRVEADFRADGSLPGMQYLHINAPQTGYHLFNVRHQLKNLLIGQSPSDWSFNTVVDAVAGSTTVADLGGGNLSQCLTDNGYSATQILALIESLDCANSGLNNADVQTIGQHFAGLRYLSLANNSNIFATAGLENLSFLSWLDVSQNVYWTPIFYVYDQIDSFVFANGSMTDMPEPPVNASYVDFSGNNPTNGLNLIVNNSGLRDRDLVALDLSRDPLLPQVSSFEASLLSELSGESVSTLDLSGHILNDVNAFSAVNNLAYLMLNDTTHLNGELKVNGFAGLCALSANNSKMTGVDSGSKRPPIQYLSLQGNTSMQRVKPLHTELYRPHWLDMSGATDMKCHGHYRAMDNATQGVVPALTDYSVAGAIVGLPNCLTQIGAVHFQPADDCLMDPVKNVSVFADAASASRLVTWEIRAAVISGDTYNRWGVTHHEVRAYDVNDNLIASGQVPLGATEQSLRVYAMDAVTFGVLACTPSRCGYELTQSVIETGLTSVDNAQVNWLNGGDQFELSFTYPDTEFNSVYGKPERFELMPIDAGVPTGTAVVMPVGGSNLSPWTSPVLDRATHPQDAFAISACRDDQGCALPVLVDLSPTSVPVPSALGFSVFEDTEDSVRYFAWDFPDPALLQLAGVEFTQIQAFDAQDVLIDQYFVSLGDGDRHHVRDLTPVKYTLQLCSAYGCSAALMDAVFAAGLTRPDQVDTTWDISDPQNKSFRFTVHYPLDTFNETYGRPDYFEIQDRFDGSYVQHVPVNGGHLKLGWISQPISRNAVIGDDFSVRACHQAVGCSLPHHLAVEAPLAAEELPQPQIILANPSVNVGTHFTLQWEMPGYAMMSIPDDVQPPGTLDLDDLREVVDYIRINEIQPYGSASAPFWYHHNNFITKPVVYYTEDFSGRLDLHRLAKGNYGFTLQACVRDRVNGDRCSAPSDSAGYNWAMKRNTNVGTYNQLLTDGWYQNAGKFGIRWSYNTTSQQPDYFWLESDHHTNSRCVVYGANGTTVESHHKKIKIDYRASGDYDLSEYCDDFRQVSLNVNDVATVIGPPTGSWRISPCVNGAGCGGYASSNDHSWVYFADFDDPADELAAPAAAPVVLNPIIGGPGDLKPGHWWNPDQAGTGWSFYWASQLRYPSVHGDYGRSYDLVAYWMAYKQVDGVWTPTWFISNMVQTNENNLGEHFQGDLLLKSYDTDNDVVTHEIVGNLRVFFDQTDNRHVRVTLSVHDPDNVATVFDPVSDYSVAQDEYQFLLEDIGIRLIDTNFDPTDNNANHYSGGWAPQNIDGSRDQTLSWLVWLSHYLEVSTVFMFDTQGDPIWVQAHTCKTGVGNCSPVVPGAGYYDDYVHRPNEVNTFMTVSRGFNPLANTPYSDGEIDNLVFVGEGGRNFIARPEYTESGFWLNLNSSFTEDGLTRTLLKSIGARPTNGAQTNNLVTMHKFASFHDIRFFINDEDESETVCDPNTNAWNDCQIKFTWFTDDFFPDIVPYFRHRINSATAWSALQPLDDICPGVPLNEYVTIGHTCFINEEGEYQFELHKDNYDVPGATVPIAESEILQIVKCTETACLNNQTPQAAEPAPLIENKMGLIGVDPDSDAVGVTAGAFDVDQSGNANYNLPIFAPKGRGGLAPQLGLSYNSSAGNGVAGMGWHINGTSTITRCLRSREHDPGLTVYPPVRLNWDDVFCLDGARLFVVSESATEVEYRTEINNFSRIVAEKHVNYPNGPRSFVVYTKSGERWLFGAPDDAFKAGAIFPVNNSDGAQIKATNGAVHTWLLAEVADRVTTPNRIHFAYDTRDGQSYLSRVRWSNLEAGESPHYEIHFNYSGAYNSDAPARVDAMHHRGIGTEYKAHRYLQNVSTLIRQNNSGGAALQEVRHLKLNYDLPGSASNPTGVMRLASAQTCVNDGGVCLRPVAFEWDHLDTRVGLSNALADQFNGADIGKMKKMGHGSYKPIDINGDGIMELIFIHRYDDGNWLEEDVDAFYWIVGNSDHINVQGASCQNMGTPTDGGYFDRMCDTGIQPIHADEVGSDFFNAEKWFVYDFNGDGYQDLLTSKRDDSLGDLEDDYHVYFSNGSQLCLNNLGSCSGLAPHPLGIRLYHKKAGASFVDYTSDGVPDLLTLAERNVNGATVYNYKLYPMQLLTGQATGGAQGRFYAPVNSGSYFIEIDTAQLEPVDLRCNVKLPDNSYIARPCMKEPTWDGLNIVGSISAGKIEAAATDFNGDGYNDFLYSYKYVYSSTKNCTAHFSIEDDPEGPVDIDPANAVPEGAYTSLDSLDPVQDNGQILGGIDDFGRCEHRFKAMLLFDKDPITGEVNLKFGGRLGIVSNASESDYAPDDQPNLHSCLGDNGLNSTACQGINEAGRGVSLTDINGDGLSDLVYHATNSSLNYRLNLGEVDDQAHMFSTLGQNVDFERLVFGPSLSIVTGLTVATDGFTVCRASDRDNYDHNACARKYLTQLIDYDLDGDLDVLVPENVTENGHQSVMYELYKYGLLPNNTFGYLSPVSTNILAWDHHSNRQPQDYNNALWDINGDGHVDLFQVLRRYNEDGQNWDDGQFVRLGSKPWGTRNKITAVDHQIGGNGLQSRIEVAYTAATKPNADVYNRHNGSFVDLNYGQGSPVFDLFSPYYLVSEVSKTAPTAGAPNDMTTVFYSYEGLKIQGGGRGSLGFAAIETYDPYHDVLTRSDYRQDFPYIGMPAQTLSEHSAGILSESYNEYATHSQVLANGYATLFPYLKRSYEKSKQLNLEGDPAAAQKYRIDVLNPLSDHKVLINDFIYTNSDALHGNLSESESRVCKGNTARPIGAQTSASVCADDKNNTQLVEYKRTVNLYNDDVNQWYLGRLELTTVTSGRVQANGAYDEQSRATEFRYDPATGLLTQEIVHGDVHQYLRIMHVYDDFGQKEYTHQCSSHLSENACKSTPVLHFNTDPLYIHRFSQTVYDSEWQEYVDTKKVLVRNDTVTPLFDASLTGILESAGNPVTVLNQGLVDPYSTHAVSTDPYAGGAVRDIYGNPRMVAQTNGPLTRTVYGYFGEAQASANNTGAMSRTTKRWCEGTEADLYKCPAGASWVVIATAAGAPTSRKYYDTLGREVRAQVQNFNGDWQTTDTEYDLMGRTVRQSEPHVRNALGQLISPLYWTRTWFGPLDRVVLIDSPDVWGENHAPLLGSPMPPVGSIPGASDDVITTTAYAGLSISTTNSKGQTTTQDFDAAGRILTAHDADGGVVEYEYDGYGNLVDTTSYLNNQPITITMGYDALGRKTSMNDPDKGDWAYIYNAQGDLVEQYQIGYAASTRVNQWFDVNGRMFFRQDADGTLSIWEYDSIGDAGQLGRLRREHVRGQYSSHGVAKTVTYLYDAFGRVDRTLTTVDDQQNPAAPAITTYVSRTVFDQHGRVFQQFDAADDAVNPQVGHHPGLQFMYNDYGYQSVIRDAENGLFGQEYYRALNVDQRGQVVHERHNGAFETTRVYQASNGLLQSIQSHDSQGFETQKMSFAFDPIGNLIRRTDHVINNGSAQEAVNEVFFYDDLNRLIQVHRDASDHGNNPADPNLSPYAINQYDETGNLTKKQGWNLTYAHPSKPHAVTQAAPGNVTKTRKYIYDSRGNVTEMRNHLDQLTSRYIYSSYDKVTRIEANDHVSEVSYDAERSRYRRTDHASTETANRVTHYLGSVEYIYELNKPVRVKRQLGTLIIEVSDHVENRRDWTLNYLLKDHLGSTHTVVNRQGQNVQRFSFNAWGERRRPPLAGSPHVYWWYPDPWATIGQEIDETTNRGFTGHEHFDQVGIIHMNGRIYDPIIGRFLQADPIIQDPFSTQSLNRYSYVMNNPLSYTDPSGYSRLRKGWWRMPVAIAVSVWTAGAASALMATSSAYSALGGISAALGGSGAGFFAMAASYASQALITTVVGGAAVGAISSGNLKGALKGGIVAAVTFGIGHGFDGMGGIGSEHSFSRIFAHSMVSGVSAEIDGGKFGHGFASAFMSQQIGKLPVFRSGHIAKQIVANAILQGLVSELTGGKFANGAMSAAFRVAFNQVIYRGEKIEQDSHKAKYDAYYERLSEHEKNATEKAFDALRQSMDQDEKMNSGRVNNIIGLAIYQVEKSSWFGWNKWTDLEVSADSPNLFDSSNVEQPPTTDCNFLCAESLDSAKYTGLHSLVFRIKDGSQVMMMHMIRFQQIANTAQAPVLLQDVKNQVRYLWNPK